MTIFVSELYVDWEKNRCYVQPEKAQVSETVEKHPFLTIFIQVWGCFGRNYTRGKTSYEMLRVKRLNEAW